MPSAPESGKELGERVPDDLHEGFDDDTEITPHDDAQEGERGPGEQRVTWAELFFDLTFVFAITQVTALLASDTSTSGVIRAFAVLTPFWWAWIGTVYLANVTYRDDVAPRIALFTCGLLAFVMSLAVPQAFGDRALTFAGAYLVLRWLLAALSRVRFGAWTANPYTFSALVTTPLFFATAFLDTNAQTYAWTGLMLLELSTPLLFRRQVESLEFEATHLPERFGLFLIIALGESIVAVGTTASAEELSDGAFLAAAVAFCLTVGLWWTYFHFANSAVSYALKVAKDQPSLVIYVLSYGHYLLVGSIIAIAVGQKDAVKHPLELMGRSEGWLLCGGAALFCATFVYQRRVMFGTWSPTRPWAAVACLLVGLTTYRLGGLGVLSLLVAVFVVLAVVEQLVVARESTDEAPDAVDAET
jgi:low temperature requirement protein LtrA